MRGEAHTMIGTKWNGTTPNYRSRLRQECGTLMVLGADYVVIATLQLVHRPQIICRQSGIAYNTDQSYLDAR